MITIRQNKPFMRIIAFTLLFAMLACLLPTGRQEAAAKSQKKTILVWDGNEIKEAKKTQTEAGEIYEVKSGAELAWVGEQVNSGRDSFLGKTIKIAEDIELGNHPWTPIGTEKNPFKGDVCGDNHTICGIFIDSSEDYQGLFGYVYNGNISTLQIKDSSIKGKNYVGSVAGYVYSTNDNELNIQKCDNFAKVSGEQYAGGIIGHGYTWQGHSSVTLENCSNYGLIEGDSYVGGIVGNLSAGYTYVNVFTRGSTNIVNCKNYGKVVSSGRLAGGIVAYNRDGWIKACVNRGEISGASQIGGIAGTVNSNTMNQSKQSCEDCFNKGIIEAKQTQAGGIIGNASYSDGYFCMRNCVNAGNIKGGASELGGLIGRLGRADIENSGNSGAVNENTTCGSIIGQVACGISQMQIRNVYSANGCNKFIGAISTGLCGSLTLRNCYDTKTASQGVTRLDDTAMKDNGFVEKLNNWIEEQGKNASIYTSWSLEDSEWNKGYPVLISSNDNTINLHSLMNYDRYQAKYYSKNASVITSSYMTYSEIEDSYTPTEYALNNILSFGWNKKFGFSDDSEIWETVLLDVLLRRSADSGVSADFEKKALKLDKDLLDIIHKNNIADSDGSLDHDNKEKLKIFVTKYDEVDEILDSESVEAIEKILGAAKDVKEFVKLYAQYVELRKLVSGETKAFLKQMRRTKNYNDIPNFRKALDSTLKYVDANPQDLAQLVIAEMATDKLITKAINSTVKKAAEVLIPGVAAVIDFTKETTIFMMDMVCGTSELAQINVYLYILDCIDESATEAFQKSTTDCLASNGQDRIYQAVNGGLQFLIDLKTYGLTVCRNWSDIITTDLLTRVKDNLLVNIDRQHADIVNSYFNLNHPSTEDERKQYVEDLCRQDEKFINLVLKNQPAFARVQWFKDRGESEKENECLILFKIENPDGTTTLHTHLVLKNMAVTFPKVEEKNGYIAPDKWYTDRECTKEVGDYVIAKTNTIFYTSYKKFIYFSQLGGGDIKIDGILFPTTTKKTNKQNSLVISTKDSKAIYAIPAYVEGYKVAELGDDIFASCPEITEVFIPATVSKIDDNAFDSLSDSTLYQYVEGSAAEEYIKRMGYQNTVAKKELYFKDITTTMYVGESKQLELIRSGTCENSDIAWQSSNETIASVKDGMISAKKSGTVEIAASTLNGGKVTALCTVTVKDKVASSTDPTKPVEPAVKPTTPEKPAEPTVTPTDPPIDPTKPSTDPINPSVDPSDPAAKPENPPTNPTESTDPATSGKLPAKGKIITDTKSKATYTVTKTGKNGGTVTYTKPKGKNMASVKIPSTVTIGGITYNVTAIAPNAFKNCKWLEKITIGNNIRTIGKGAFSGCSKLRSVSFGKNVTAIGNMAFYNCTALTKVVIPSKVVKIGKKAFFGCKKLKYIIIKTKKLTAKRIGANAFKGTSAKAVVKAPKGKAKTYKKLLQAKGLNKRAKVK